jgi:hypothetical protein
MNWLVIVCVVVLLFFVSNQPLPFFEGYSNHMYSYDTMPAEVYPTHGLRGDELAPVDIRTKYIWPESHWRMVSSGGHMYESRNPPHPTEGGCSKVSCPPIFDRTDANCWYCN